MPQKLTWAIEDDAGDKAYKGCTVPGEAIVDAGFATFMTALMTYSDGVLRQRSIASVVDISTGSASGTKRVENFGCLLLKDEDTGQRFAISIPAIKETAVDKNGAAPAKLTSAAEAALKSAFETLTGLTTVRVRSFIMESAR